jgi:hypothetical protein
MPEGFAVTFGDPLEDGPSRLIGVHVLRRDLLECHPLTWQQMHALLTLAAAQIGEAATMVARRLTQDGSLAEPGTDTENPRPDAPDRRDR